VNAISKDNGGVWIDHRKALIVVMSSGAQRTTSILSNAEQHPERAGESPLKGSYEAAQVAADDNRQRAFTGELNRYYDAVIAALRQVGSIVIFGPGEAKVELQKRLVKRKLGARIAAIETAGKMTERQVAAKVRAFFQGA